MSIQACRHCSRTPSSAGFALARSCQPFEHRPTARIHVSQMEEPGRLSEGVPSLFDSSAWAPKCTPLAGVLNDTLSGVLNAHFAPYMAQFKALEWVNQCSAVAASTPSASALPDRNARNPPEIVVVAEPAGEQHGEGDSDSCCVWSCRCRWASQFAGWLRGEAGGARTSLMASPPRLHDTMDSTM